jgi:phage baseplate assembly protein W
MADITVPHFALPFRLAGDGSFAVVEQDSDDEVVQSVEILLRTRVGSRIELPEYGIEDPTFTVVPDIAGILDAIADWEPRAQVTIGDEIDSKDELMHNISVQVANGGGLS